MSKPTKRPTETLVLCICMVWRCLDADLTAHLLLCTLCNLLLLVDVIREGLGGSDDSDGSLVFQNVALSSRQHLNDLVLNLS